MESDSAARSGVAAVGSKQEWFTVDGANRSLPLVGRIVADVIAEHARLTRLQPRGAAQLQKNRGTLNGRSRRQAAAAVARLNDLLAELESIGCRLMDFGDGSVDFPARRNGAEIRLCWKPGEPRVLYWHEPCAGSSARKPIDEACL